MRHALSRLGSGGDLSLDQSRDAVAEIIDGSAEAAEIAAFLTALRIKGETSDELAGAVLAAREKMVRFDVLSSLRPILDTCGTGGDGANTVNVSTAAAIVVAACGVRVAKHGNRSASGNSGSAEVLTELGVKIDADHSVLIRCLEEVGVTFLYAPAFHPALRHAATVRKTLPFRTLFNLVGPLANPARPDAQVIGVPDSARADLMARTLSRLHPRAEDSSRVGLPMSPAGARAETLEISRGCSIRALIVTGEDGMDEVTLGGATLVRGVSPHRFEFAWTPADFGLPTVPVSALAVSGPSESAGLIRSMLVGDRGPVRDVVLANAAAALSLVNEIDSVAEGVAPAPPRRSTGATPPDCSIAGPG